MKRRSFLAIFVAGFAAAFAPRAKAAPIAPLSTPAFGHPRGALAYSAGPVGEPISISTGSEWVPIDSAQGRMIEAERGRGFPFPRGTLVPMALCVKDGEIRLNLNATCVEQISTGSELVPLQSLEGQAVLNERAVNLRSDGTLRHRQHHWPR